MLPTTLKSSTWKDTLEEEFSKEYFLNLVEFLKEEKKVGKTIYPEYGHIFRLFNTIELNKVKVVILGQDPYHGKGQANGLSFSVNDGMRLPSSLKNIFKELESDLGITKDSGNLLPWVKQGVFLLNTVLTVEESKPASHQKKGWETFTDKVIETISKEREGVVFLFWGKYAQSKAGLIDSSKHLILQSPHPSPFSAYKGFFGSKPFSNTNKYLMKKGNTRIKW